jgi:hypothetical protein
MATGPVALNLRNASKEHCFYKGLSGAFAEFFVDARKEEWTFGESRIEL